MRSGLLAMMLVGCGFSASADETDGGLRGNDACITFSSQIDTCSLNAGPAVVLEGTLEFTTLTGMLTNKATGATVAVYTQMLPTLGDSVYAIIAQNVTLAPNTKLRAVGPHGFAIISMDAITLGENSLIDVGDNGAGARTASCTNGPDKGQNDTGGAAGGGGAGFGGAGGKGGDGNSDDFFGDQSNGGDPGEALEVPLGPRGGCPGAAGGDGNEVGGAGGRGGGAVWLAAGNRIELAAGAGVNAGGSGGGGGIRTGSQGDAGGGGGGSGGMIWIESPRVRSMGTIAANGGGGGEGSGGDNSGTMGTAGQLTTTAAAGGTGGSNSGAAGGAGGSKLDGKGLTGATPEPGGGGGGGGGVGFIRVLSPDKMISTASP